MYSEAQQETLNRFGKHLELLRKRQGLSFRKLAQRCNIDYSNLKKYEKGEINPSMLSLVDLASALDLPLKELMDF
ncbi:helix-turn-helix domain-containing protein [Mucilaginibacter terrae]|uniref:Transcriptional regulator with XRE-family HTH domain n=1 Tax=Mucilaginibacter terrae TaxID=1955052 RepID=A0ABU3GRF8_9SPHI|nr:helix-turn-helix transcriptional regulator [Mucilaginibacter terrae]MDT3401210.1 transcriptional regulator with XRE-family HTH domain [Mucilaginibacter terrae]